MNIGDKVMTKKGGTVVKKNNLFGVTLYLVRYTYLNGEWWFWEDDLMKCVTDIWSE